MKVEEIDRFDGRVEGVVHDDRWIRKSVEKGGKRIGAKEGRTVDARS